MSGGTSAEDVAAAVARLRSVCNAANEKFGGIAWSINGLYRVCINYGDVLRQCVGIDEPSPFKRCAAFAVVFMDDKNHPIYGEFSCHPLKESLSRIDRYAGAVIAFEYVRFSLHGATLEKRCGTVERLDQPIKVSDHTYADIIHALSHCGTTGSACFHVLSLLFEQLAYMANPNASYPPEI